MKQILFQLVVIATVFVAVTLARPSSSPNYGEAPGLAGSTSPPYAKYDTVNVTIWARDNRTQQQWAANFYPRVDEFSLLELAGTSQWDYTFNPNLTIWLEIPQYSNLTSLKDSPKLVYTVLEESGDQVYIPYFTALVLLNKGVVTDFQWDGGCKSCATDLCITDQCGTKRIKNNEDICKDQANCNIKVYLAWMGRDKDDSKCRSVNSMPNNFSKYSVAPITNFGNGLFDDVIYKFTQNAPNPLE